ncbi:hypothetical protein BSL78_09755 [Apostichopus japonicus]|uniref:EB domain-containing protein n=1 Tax=Stichopus japonicus TaxID=307972 RepID=A0A2G8KZB7_STIJA|nr:hypothetical protein BSL78_09755 [Apostichopus japonicus]
MSHLGMWFTGSMYQQEGDFLCECNLEEGYARVSEDCIGFEGSTTTIPTTTGSTTVAQVTSAEFTTSKMTTEDSSTTQTTLGFEGSTTAMPTTTGSTTVAEVTSAEFTTSKMTTEDSSTTQTTLEPECRNNNTCSRNQLCINSECVCDRQTGYVETENGCQVSKILKVTFAIVEINSQEAIFNDSLTDRTSTFFHVFTESRL